jgi:hypothetical protein
MEILHLPALTSLLFGEYLAIELTADLGSSLYSLGADPTKNPPPTVLLLLLLAAA